LVWENGAGNLDENPAPRPRKGQFLHNFVGWQMGK
jgi:hypothetical protein